MTAKNTLEMHLPRPRRTPHVGYDYAVQATVGNEEKTATTAERSLRPTTTASAGPSTSSAGVLVHGAQEIGWTFRLGELCSRKHVLEESRFVTQL